jgi:DNA-binding CsgD family transcriptional regulator
MDMFERAERRDAWTNESMLPEIGAGLFGAGIAEAEILALLCPDWRGAMLVVDLDTYAVAYANIAAIEMFKRRHPLFVARGALELSSPHGSHRLDEALKDAVARDIGRSTIIVDDPQHAVTYSIRIFLPQGFMRDVLRRHLHNGSRLAVLHVSTGKGSVSRLDLDALAQAFGLTVAEANIMGLLAQGRSLEEIAALRGVGLETVRSQCKPLLNKTRSRRRSDLVKLVVAFCAQDTSAE